MSAGEIIEALIGWTPFLATGFAWNIIVSLMAMIIGTPIGLLLALMRISPARTFNRGGGALTAIARGAPTFVMLFYLVYLVPEKIDLFGLAGLVVPAWFKASLALGIAVAGYVSDVGLSTIGYLRRSQNAEALFIIPAWTSYFLVIVMASSTASVIGVPEVVYRSQTVIGAVDQLGFAVWVYLYAMTWFLIFGGLVSMLMWQLNRQLSKLKPRTDSAGTRIAQSFGSRRSSL